MEIGSNLYCSPIPRNKLKVNTEYLFLVSGEKAGVGIGIGIGIGVGVAGIGAATTRCPQFRDFCE